MDPFFGVVAALGFFLALIVHVLAFAGMDIIGRFPMVWMLHFGCFFVFIPLAFSAGVRYGLIASWRQIFAGQRWATSMLVAVTIYAGLTFALVSFLSEGAAPDIREGRFVLQDHGRIIREITAQEYHLQKAYVARLFSAGWLVFYLAPALYFLLRSKAERFAPKP